MMLSMVIIIVVIIVVIVIAVATVGETDFTRPVGQFNDIHPGPDAVGGDDVAAIVHFHVVGPSR